MKKIMVLSFSLLAVVLLTGCGGKTLTCTKTEESYGISMEQKVSVKFKNDKVQKVSMDINTKATTDEVKEEWESYTSMMNSMYENTEKDGLSIKTKNDEKNYAYKISLNIDVNKASEDTLSEYNFEDLKNEEESLEDTKKYFEEDGYTCK